ncbi:MAG: hypothetical protein KA210_09185, partial [Bacteroidia bacterium]|nr:hypothetical protein [Bacteroidia bacterium]
MKENNNLYLLFENAVRLYPNDYCITFQNTSLTYKQLEEKVSEVHYALLANAKNEYIIGLSTT